MSNRCWGGTPARTPARLSLPDLTGRVALVGMGQELRGDDAAGVIVARAMQALLEEHQPAASASRWLAVDAGPAPENFTGLLRRFRPDVVVVVDAAHMGERAGAVGCLDWQAAGGLSASTHTLPLHVLAQYLTTELDCRLVLIGIQPGNSELGACLSPPVRAAVEYVVTALAYALSVNGGPGKISR